MPEPSEDAFEKLTGFVAVARHQLEILEHVKAIAMIIGRYGPDSILYLKWRALVEEAIRIAGNN